MKKQAPATLLELLKSLKSYEPAFRDKSRMTGTIRIKCWEPLSASDFKKVKDATANSKGVLQVTNNFMWRTTSSRGTIFTSFIKTFVIQLSAPPSQIFINQKKLK